MKLYNPNLQLIGGFAPEDVNSHIFSVTPEQFIGTDTSKINQAISFINTKGYGSVVCNGSYLLDTAIIIKKNVTLVNNGLIKMKVGMKDNIIRSEPATVGVPISNIQILGNGTFQGHSDGWGSDTPSGVGTEAWRGIAILLANCTNFKLNGFKLKNTPAWGICLEQSRFGSIKDIDFENDGSTANQDGVNVRHGSHHVVVDNISGVTNDDMIALTNLLFGNNINLLGQTIYETGKSNFDVHDVIVRNINRYVSSGVIGAFTPPVKKGGITILCHDGLKIYNVTVDGVHGDAQIYIQFTQIQYWVNAQATVNDVYNIRICNTNDAPIYFGRPIKNSSLINIARKDITATYDSGLFPVGSLNVTRKYNDGNFEFFATV